MEVDTDVSSLVKFNGHVETVFDVSCSIYERNLIKINTGYKDKAIPAELGVAIGAIPASKKLINQVLNVYGNR